LRVFETREVFALVLSQTPNRADDAPAGAPSSVARAAALDRAGPGLRDRLLRAERFITGSLPADVLRNVRVELVASIFFGPFYAALLFIPVVLQRLGASPDLVALYQSQSYIGLFLAAFSVMILPRRRLLLALAVIWTVGRGAFLFTKLWPTAVGLLVLSAIYWLSDGFPGSIYTEVVRRAYPAEVRGRALSAVRAGMALSMLAFTPLAGWLLDTAGHGVLFPLAGACGIVAAWIFTRMRIGADPAPAMKAPQHSLGELWRILRRDSRFVLHLLSVVCFGLGSLVAIAFYPAVLVDRLHLSYAEVSWLSLAQSVAWILGLVIWGRAMDRKGVLWLLRAAYLISAIAPIAFLLADSGWWLALAYLAQGLAAGAVDLGFTSASIDFADPDHVYEYAALQRTVIGIRGLIGPFLGVWLSYLGVPVAWVFILGAVLLALGAVLVSRVKPAQ